jgi:hypothetical protein
MLKRLGQERYDKLELRANEYKKRNDIETEVEIKRL